MRNSPVISPPVNRKVFLNSFTQSSFVSGCRASSHKAKEPCSAIKPLDDPGVVDHRVDLQAVAHDAGIGEKARLVGFAIAGDPVDIEALEGGEEGFALLEDGEPGEAGLVDLEREPFQQSRVVARRESRTRCRGTSRETGGRARCRSRTSGSTAERNHVGGDQPVCDPPENRRDDGRDPRLEPQPRPDGRAVGMTFPDGFAGLVRRFGPRTVA